VYTALVAYYATHRFEGPAGPGLGAYASLRLVLMAIAVAGVALVPAALENYPRSPTALFNQPIRTPRGIEQVTRHPFFMGVGLLALAHVFLATRLVGMLFFASLGAVAIGGALLQDRKLRRLRGEPYARYCEATSVVPLAGVVTGRHPISWGTVPWGALAIGVGVGLLLRAVHDSIMAWAGVWLIVGVVGGAVVATLQSWRRAQRLQAVARVPS
jgi:uncharacterized membrane protein